MTLLLATLSDEAVLITADGLSIVESFGAPGRTTLQKIVPIPLRPVAVAQCGGNFLKVTGRGELNLKRALSEWCATAFPQTVNDIAVNLNDWIRAVDSGYFTRSPSILWVAGFSKGNSRPEFYSVTEAGVEQDERLQLAAGAGADFLEGKDWSTHAEAWDIAVQRQKERGAWFFGGHRHQLQISPTRWVWLEEPAYGTLGIEGEILPPVDISAGEDIGDPRGCILAARDELQRELCRWAVKPNGQHPSSYRGAKEHWKGAWHPDWNLADRLIAVCDEVRFADPSDVSARDAQLYSAHVWHIVDALPSSIGVGGAFGQVRGDSNMCDEQEIDWAAVKVASQEYARSQGAPVVTENPDIPPIIYQYCGVDTFHAMLTNRHLWMTSVRHMNDSTEQSHFIEKAKKLLEELRQGPKPDSLYAQLLVQNVPWMELTAYACCFSKEGDLLSQWRAYAEDGAGFSVGFSTDWLKQQRRKYLPKHPLELLEVEYDDDRQLELATTCIRRYLGQVSGQNKTGRQAYSMWTITQLWTLSAACKHPSFQDEREVRLILAEIADPDSESEASRKTVGVSPLYHRQSGEQSIPYYKLSFSTDAIAEIRLGPKHRAAEDRTTLKEFLNTNGYDCDRIRLEPSQVPYR